MTRNETSYREQGRALFLAAIMVLSVFAMSTAFVGSAAAEEPAVESNPTDNIAGELLYEGQTFNVTNDSSPFDFNDSLIPGTDIADEDNLYLVRVTDRDRGDITGASTVGSSISVDGDGNDKYFELDLNGLDASEEYALSNESGSSGVFSSSFDISVQEPDADFDDDQVTDDDSDAELDIELDRNENVSEYNLTVFAEGPDDFDTEMVQTLLGGNEELNDSLYVDTESRQGSVNQDFLPLDTLDSDYGIDVDPDNRTDPDNAEELDNEGIVTFELNESALGTEDELNLEADFEALGSDFPDDGEYEFTFIITDTGASSTDTVELEEQDEDAEFSEGTYQTTAGDVGQFEFELEDTDEAWIQVGDDNSDFADILYVEADDEDEPITVDVNTRLLGTNQSQVNGSQVYDIDNEDRYASAYHDGTGHSDFGTPSGGINLFEDDGSSVNDDYDDYLSNIGISDQANETLTRPLQPTDYELQIAGTDVDDALFDADSGAGEANDQLASSVLELQQPTIGDITTHTASDESADYDDEIEDLVDSATVREAIAHEDRLVVQVEATGIYGAMVANPGGSSASDINEDFDRLDNGEIIDPEVLYNLSENEDGVTFEIVAEEGAGNQDANEVDFENADSSEVAVLADNAGGQFFVVVDTDEDGAWTNNAPDDEEDESFTASLEYDADESDDRYEFDSDEAPDPFDSTTDSLDNYPYLQQGEVLENSAEFDLEVRAVEFDNLNVDDVLEAENTEESEISGTTNIAPGSDAEIRVSSTDASSSFRNGEDVEINEDGEVSAEFDFSDQDVDDEFETTFRATGSAIDAVDSVLVEEGAIGDEAPEEDDESEDDESEEESEDESEDDESEDESEDETEDDSTEDDSMEDETEEDTEDDTPGFGALVALVAVLGAALLASRRQN